jgi:hypothetical protein
VCDFSGELGKVRDKQGNFQATTKIVEIKKTLEIPLF